MSASNEIGPIVEARPVRDWLTFGGISTTIFLLPIFFQRLFIGGEEVVSYDEYPGVALVAVGYVCHVIIIGRYLLVPSSNATTRFILERFLPLAIVSMLHIWLLVLSTDAGATTGVLAIVRQLAWVLSCLVMVHFTEPQLLLTRLIQFTHFTFAVIVLTYASYLITDFPVQLILRGGVPRAQGLLTEPSAVGCLLAGYAALAVHERNWRRLLCAIGISILVNSVISVAGLVIGIACGAIQLRVGSQRMRRAAIVGLLLITPLSVIVIPPFSRVISESAGDAMNYIETTSFAESPLYINIGERALAAASLLDTGIEIVKSGDNDVEGGLFRFASVLLLFQEMQSSWRLFVGYGLGAHAQLMEAADRSLLDFGAVAFLVSSFGLIGGMGLFGWLVWTVSGTTERLAIYAAPFVAIISFNPAGGIHMYSVALLAAFLLSRSARLARLGCK